MDKRDIAVKYCRHCGRLITLDAVDCPYCGKNTVRHTDQRECPYCRELIKGKAIKCRYCSEFLDGRDHVPEREQNVFLIEKALITGTEQYPQIEFHRPDGRQLTSGDVPPERQLPAPKSTALQKSGALPARTVKAHEIRRKPGALARVRAALAPRSKESAPARPVGAAAPRAVTVDADVVSTPAITPPPVRYGCPSCRRDVFVGDHYCENCGRDLSIPRGQREFAGTTRRYPPAYYALITGTASPVGLLFGSPASSFIACAGILLALWCLFRIATSRDQLTGLGPALGGLLTGIFWLIVILAVAT